jgi:hypothetical protein
LGDAGVRAILEFVGQRDRVHKKAPKPTFETVPAETPVVAQSAPVEGGAQE